MRLTLENLAISVLFAAMALGQAPADSGVDRVFPFTNLDTPQSFQETANAIRVITQMQQAAINNTAKTLAVHGSAEQVAVAELLFHALDQPTGAKPAPMPEYRMTEPSRAPVVRVFYLSQAPSPQAFQEIVNALRSVLEIQWVVVHNAARAIVLRGTVEQANAAESMIFWLDKSGPQPGQAALRLTENARAPVARVLYLVNTPTPRGMQEIVNTIRSISELQRVTVCNVPHAIVMRGDAGQIAVAEWLIDKLDIASAPVPAGQSAQTQLVLQGADGRTIENSIKLFYLPGSATPQSIQETVSQVRTVTGMPRVTACYGPKAVIVSGTDEQVAQAGRLIQARDTVSAQ